MIPKADGDSTHLGQRPLSVLPVIYRLCASLRLGHLRDGVEGWLPESVFSLGKGLSSVEAWFATALDIEEVLSSVGGHLKDWVQGWVPHSVFSLGNGLSLVEASFSTALDIEEAGVISCILWLLMLPSPVTLLTGPFWTPPCVDLVCLVGSGRRILLTIVRFVFGSSLLLV